jgi:glycosyltransferase involved in cell wall biosynthesis
MEKLLREKCSYRGKSGLERIRVCFYTPSANGGHAKYTFNLLSALDKVGGNLGFEFALITSEDLNPRFRETSYKIYPILPRLEPKENFSSKLHWVLSRVFHYYRRERVFLGFVSKERECKIIHFQEYSPWLAPFHFKKLRKEGFIIVYSVHNIFPHKYPPMLPPFLYNRFYRSAWRNCNGLFVHTEKLKKELEDFLGPKCPPIYVAPHGVWEVYSSSNHKDESEETKKMSNKALIFFGNVRENKGLHVLIEAMQYLEDFRLKVVGKFDSKKYKNFIYSIISKYGPGRVEIIDRFVEDEEITGFFSEASIAVLPYTTFSAQSGVLFDSIGNLVPVVVSDVGGLGEFVRKYGVGRVVPPNDPLNLSNAIKELSLPSNYTQAVNSIKRVLAKFSWDNTAKAILDIYSQLIKGSENGKGI